MRISDWSSDVCLPIYAEDCYRKAAKWGKNPQPGLALLRLAQGQDDAAETSIRNTLRETEDPVKRAELLPAFVRIMVAVKQTEEALEAARSEEDRVGKEGVSTCRSRW